MKEKRRTFLRVREHLPRAQIGQTDEWNRSLRDEEICGDGLSRAFENKRIVKYYVGVSERKPRKKMGTVTGDLKKARRGMYKLMRTMENPSKTTFVSRGFTAEVGKKENNLRFFLFKPRDWKDASVARGRQISR